MALLREVGFPIFVCLWFMWRMERKIDGFLESQMKVLLAITVLAQALDVDIQAERRQSKKMEAAS